MDIRRLAEKYEDYVISCRHWLHQHPELSWQEYETTEYIEQELQKMGLSPKRFDAEHTGLYAMINGGKAGAGAKTIMLRADIDALPTQEQTDLPYASIYDGRMHSCGHDTHAAMLLGAAKILTEIRDELPGNVKLLFQAAEETAIGAKYYLAQGVLDGVQAVYGCHISTMLDSPYISVEPGPRTASSDEFKITVRGAACHGGMPQYGKDAIVAAAAIIMNLQTLVSRTVAPIDPLVITVGKINGGLNYNIVSDHVELAGCVRTYSKNLRAEMADKITELIENTAKAFGCTAELDYQWKTASIIHDDERMNQIARNAVIRLYGEEGLGVLPPIGGSDDFAFFSERTPGIFAWIGGRNQALDCVYNHHHASFNIDESVLKRGAAMYAQMAIDFFSGV